jgi:hypothetical protein
VSDHTRGGRAPATPGVPTWLRVWSAPKDGTKSYVRFLTDYSGLLVHRKNGPARACPGYDLCPTAEHRGPTLWYGYAAGEVWSVSDQEYKPYAIEITERLAEFLTDKGLRGQVWEIFRVIIKEGKTEVQGILNDVQDEADLPEAFPFQSPVCRVYHTSAMQWGVAPPLPPRIAVIPSKGKPPILPVAQPKPNERVLSAGELAEKRREFNRAASVGGKGANNGSH